MRGKQVLMESLMAHEVGFIFGNPGTTENPIIDNLADYPQLRYTPTAREARKGWAALIKQVHESSPICCPTCAAEMKIIAFIERHQTDVIEKILRHCGLWEEAPARDPPAVPEPIRG